MHYHNIIDTSTMSSISSTTTLSRSHPLTEDEKDTLIDVLQQELGKLKAQVGEFSDLRMSVVKVTGKNGMRKLKDKYLTTSDKVNASEIAHVLRISLWPHIKLMPEKWHKWSEHPKSICQRLMSAVGVPNGFTSEEYWTGVARSLANDKLCALRSNIKQSMFNQFKGKPLQLFDF